MPLPILETTTQAKRRPRYRRVEVGERPAFRLTERDRHLLKCIYDHRFITAAMLQDLAPAPQLTPAQQEAVARLVSARRAQANRLGESERAPARTKRAIQWRLQALYHHGYVQRLKLSNNDPIVYSLGNRGADELTLHYGIDRQQVDWTSKNREVGERYLEHGLMVSRFRYALALALRERPEGTLAFWEPGGSFKAPVAYEETVRGPDKNGTKATKTTDRNQGPTVKAKSFSRRP